MEASALRRPRAGILPQSRRLLAAFPDERLVDQIRRGNSAAFEVAYDRHYRGILSFCRHMLGSQEEAEDAVQQTFASAFTDLQSNGREIRLKAWLFTIARNRCLSVLRARREQPAELDDVPATGGLSEQVQQRADLRELLLDLRALPDEQREALVLCEIGDLSQSEVADVIGVEPMKVKALVFQARSALIENREARAIPCVEIREQLATATGGALRRGPLRRHLKACEGCSEYRDQVRHQRSALALVLPVVPTLGLKDSVLAGMGMGGGAGGAGLAAGGVAGGGSLITALGGAGGLKLAVGAVLAAGTVAGAGFGVERAVSSGDDGGGSVQSANASSGQGGSASSPGGGDPGQTPAAPIVNRDDSVATEKRKAQKRKSERKRDGERKSDDDDKASGKRSKRGRKKGRGRRAAQSQNPGRRLGGKKGGGKGPGQPQQTNGNSGGDRKGTRVPVPVPPPAVGERDGKKAGDGKKADGDGDKNRVAPVALPLSE